MRQVVHGFIFGMALIFFAVGVSTTVDVLARKIPAVCK